MIGSKSSAFEENNFARIINDIAFDFCSDHAIKHSISIGCGCGGAMVNATDAVNMRRRSSMRAHAGGKPSRGRSSSLSIGGAAKASNLVHSTGNNTL